MNLKQKLDQAVGPSVDEGDVKAVHESLQSVTRSSVSEISNQFARSVSEGGADIVFTIETWDDTGFNGGCEMRAMIARELPGSERMRARAEMRFSEFRFDRKIPESTFAHDFITWAREFVTEAGMLDPDMALPEPPRKLITVEDLRSLAKRFDDADDERGVATRIRFDVSTAEVDVARIEPSEEDGNDVLMVDRYSVEGRTVDEVVGDVVSSLDSASRYKEQIRG